MGATLEKVTALRTKRPSFTFLKSASYFKALQRLCVFLEAYWSLQSLRAVMRRNRAQNHPALSPWGCWGWSVSSSKVLWGLKPPYHLEQERPHGHPTGPVESWLVGYRPLSGTWSANVLCHFVWQIFFLTPFVHNNFCFGKSNLSLLSFVVCAFGNRSKKS